MDKLTATSRFEWLSWLRRKEAFHRFGATAEAHVRLYLDTFPPSQRGVWQCPKCGSEIAQRARPRDSDGKLKKHCGCCNWKPALSIPHHLRPTNRANRIAYKRQLRAKVAAAAGKEVSPAFVKLYRAHVECWEKHQREERQRSKSQHKARLLSDPEYRRQYQRKETENLSDGYVAKRLRKNMPALKGVKLPRELIEVERMRLLIVREVSKRNRPNE